MTGRSRNADDLRAEIQELFDELWQVPRFAGARRAFQPQCDCYRTDDPPQLHVVVELPGVDPASVRLTAAGRALVIAGVRPRPQIPGARYRQMEIAYDAFQRRVELGEPVDPGRAGATYDRGLLRIDLPIVEERP
ncbi:MAG: Hsp20/alpha crystallin family protein [Gaiellaceae bacterium]